MRPTRTYYFTFVGLGMVMSMLGPTLPDLAAQTGVPLDRAGLLFSTRSLGYMTGVLLAGRFYDRLPGHPLLAAALTAAALSMLVVPAVSSFWLLAGLITVMGVAASTLDVGGNTLLVWASRPERVGPAMTTLHFAFGVGALAAPLLVAASVSGTGGMAGAYVFTGLAMLPVGWWYLRRPSPAVSPSRTAGAPAPTSRPERVLLVVLFFFVYAGFEVSYSGWVYTYGLQRHGFAPATAAYLTSVFWGMLTAGRLLLIPLSARFAPHQILHVALSLGLAILAAMLALGASPAVTWLATAGLGLAAAGVFPNMLAFAGRILPVTGRNTGWFFVGASLGAMSIPWFIGRLLPNFGPAALPGVSLASLALALALFAGLYRFTRATPAVSP